VLSAAGCTGRVACIILTWLHGKVTRFVQLVQLSTTSLRLSARVDSGCQIRQHHHITVFDIYNAFNKGLGLAPNLIVYRMAIVTHTKSDRPMAESLETGQVAGHRGHRHTGLAYGCWAASRVCSPRH
jgi:hypothetical protein